MTSIIVVTIIEIKLMNIRIIIIMMILRLIPICTYVYINQCSENIWKNCPSLPSLPLFTCFLCPSLKFQDVAKVMPGPPVMLTPVPMLTLLCQVRSGKPVTSHPFCHVCNTAYSACDDGYSLSEVRLTLKKQLSNENIMQVCTMNEVKLTCGSYNNGTTRDI